MEYKRIRINNHDVSYDIFNGYVRINLKELTEGYDLSGKSFMDFLNTDGAFELINIMDEAWNNCDHKSKDYYCSEFVIPYSKWIDKNLYLQLISELSELSARDRVSLCNFEEGRVFMRDNVIDSYFNRIVMKDNNFYTDQEISNLFNLNLYQIDNLKSILGNDLNKLEKEGYIKRNVGGIANYKWTEKGRLKLWEIAINNKYIFI